MDRILVIIFDEQENAQQACQALRDLDAEGAITQYSSALVKRQENEQLELVGDENHGPLGCTSETLVGSLIGVLGGTIGKQQCATIGAIGGMWYDIYNAGIDIPFIEDVDQHLRPDRFAVVTEIMESLTAGIDAKMEEIGGTVFRRLRMIVDDNRFIREMDTARAELDHLEEEWKNADEETKERLAHKVAKAREKLKTSGDKAKNQIHQIRQEADAKVAALRDRIANSSSGTKKKIEDHVENVIKQYDQHLGHLKQELQKAVTDVTGGRLI